MGRQRHGTNVPDLVRRIRDARGLTQEQLARELGVTFSTVNGWENGKHVPIPLLLRALIELGTKCGVQPRPGPEDRAATLSTHFTRTRKATE